MSGEVDVAGLTRPTVGAPGESDAEGRAPTRRVASVSPRRPRARGDVPAPALAWHPGRVNADTPQTPASEDAAPTPNPTDAPTYEAVIGNWLTLPDVALEMEIEVSQVRRLIEDGQLVAVRRGTPVVRSVPAEMLLEGELIPHLAGTLTVLRDGGFSDEELLTWLFTEDETLPGRPIDQLRAGQRGEVRRRALALAF